MVNSVRAAIALAAAVAVADLSSVQHGFWVVLGALSVLRTNAMSTGASALRAFAGTVIGFVLGGALVLAIGGSSTALWIAFPIALFVTAYVPTAPGSRELVWLRESLDHLAEHLAELVAPAQQVAVFRRRPWWR